MKTITRSLGNKLRKECKNRIETERFENQVADILDSYSILRNSYVSGG